MSIEDEGAQQRMGVVAGHVCVDVIPTFEAGETEVALDEIMRPGRLTQVGPILLSTGGAVSNAGLALHRLGVPVSLMGKLGGDIFGRAAIELFDRVDPILSKGMIIAPNEPGSYTIVINPPGVDRVFLHCPGPNDTFSAADVPLDALAEAAFFHFGYPPIMRQMYLNRGENLAAMLASVHAMGLTVSLDLSQPDPNSEAGRQDWVAILERSLPHVDVFGANVEEISFMLDRPAWADLRAGGHPTGALLRSLGDRLIAMGTAAVLIKLGEHGLYVRTSGDAERLRAMGALAPPDVDGWLGREVLTPCLRAAVVGTTGAGDCTHAGFLAAMVHGEPFEAVVTAAVAVGACSVESADATGGIPPWGRVRARLAAGWQRHPQQLRLEGWAPLGALWLSPGDRLCL